MANDFDTLVAGTNQQGDNLIDAAKLKAQIEARDAQIDNPFSKDVQVSAIRNARSYLADKLIRTNGSLRWQDQRSADYMQQAKRQVLAVVATTGITRLRERSLADVSILADVQGKQPVDRK